LNRLKMGLAGAKVARSELTPEIPDATKTILVERGWKRMKRIGQGGFAKAWLVESSEGNQAVCKVIDLCKGDESNIFQEAKLLASLHHPYVVRYRDSFCTDGFHCLIMDFCEGGELAKQIRRTRRKHQRIPEELVLRWFTQAMMSLKYIHGKHILHRDLKPGNFFLTKSGSLKLGDFGIATKFGPSMESTIKIGTPYYISPEVWEGKPYLASSDLWSMGCILYELCALQVPFEGTTIPSISKKICEGPLPSFPDAYPDFLQHLCMRLLDRRREHRPSAVEVLQIPEIHQVHMQLIKEQELLRVAEADLDFGEHQRGPVALGGYTEGDFVEYYSLTNCQWLPAKVIKVESFNSKVHSAKGPVQIDLKPGVWLSFEEQSSRLRSRKDAEVPFDVDSSDPFDSENVSDDASTDAPGDELPPVLALASTTGVEEEVDFHAKAVEEKEGDARRTFAA